MKDVKLYPPKNMTRVLVKHKDTGTLEFAQYCDRRFKCDSGRLWISSDLIESWMSIEELKSKLKN